MQSLLEGFDANLEMYGKPNDQKKTKKNRSIFGFMKESSNLVERKTKVVFETLSSCHRCNYLSF